MFLTDLWLCSCCQYDYIERPKQAIISVITPPCLIWWPVHILWDEVEDKSADNIH